MRMSVYDGGAWKQVIVAYVFDEAAAAWKQVNSIHLYRNAQWEEVHNDDDLYVITSPTINSLIKAVIGSPAANVFYWITNIGGRALGNIDNSFIPELDITDVGLLGDYALNPSSVGASEREWIEREIIPYATIYPPPP